MVLDATQRKHAAILAADVADYARLMEEDEAGTHQRIRAVLTGLFEPKVQAHQGRIIRLIGDGALVEFERVEAALDAAVAVQTALAEIPQGSSPHVRIAFRMGINVGDVIVDEGDIYGTGVNIAARLEALADPGGIFISAAAHEAVRGQEARRFADLGPQVLKNIEAPVRVFRVLFDGAVAPPFRTPHVMAELPPCPYRGLEAFREEDAQYYFGRSSSLDELEAAVRSRPLTALLGPSGSGKSSLVFAGLIPRLRSGPPIQIDTMRPEATPILNLERALARLAVTEDSGAPLPDRLLIVDQFEQLYSHAEHDADRQRFVAMLLDAAARRITVLITLRADFLARALGDRALADALRGADVKLGPMSDAELRAAIENPARRQGVRFEVGLADRILIDIRDQAGGLPLLEFTLTELWSRQQYGRLTYAAYDAIGGVNGAIASYAEQVFLTFGQAEQDMVRRIFLQLVRPGEGTDDTARVVSRMEFRSENWDAVGRLADTRLLVTRHDEGTGEDLAEVVHEALLGAWQRLRHWIDADRQFLLWRQRLSDARRAWAMAGQDVGYLLRDAPLLVAADWLAGRADDIQAEDRAFIRQSQDHFDRRARASRRRRRLITAALALSSVVFFGLFLGAAFFYRESQTQKESAQLIQSQYYADLSLDQLRAGEPERAVATALAALPSSVDAPERPYLGEAEVQLYRAMDTVRGKTVIEHDGSAVWRTAFSQDGRLLATGANDGSVRLFAMDPLAPKRLAALQSHDQAVLDLCFTPDGKKLLTASADGTARVYGLADGKMIELAGHQDVVGSVACGPDGRFAVTASWDGQAIVWNLETGRLVRRLAEAPTAALTAAAFAPDGSRILTTSQDGRATIWRWPEGLPEHRLEGQGGPIWWGAFDPEGSRVLTASEGKRVEGANPGVRPIERVNTLWLWDTRTGERLLALDGHEEAVVHAAFSPKARIYPKGGALVATVSREGSAKVWDSVTGQLLVTLGGHGGPVLWAAFSADGERLATASRDGLARLWNPRSGEQIGFPSRHDGAAVQVAFSQDGRRMVSAGEDGRVILADAEPGRQLVRFDRHGGPVGVVALAPDLPERVLTASRSHTVWGDQMKGDATARIWNALTGEEEAVLGEHEDSIRAAAFAPAGDLAVTGSEDRSAIVWRRLDDGGWTLASRLLGHEAAVISVAFDPKSAEVATASEDGTVRLWTEDGKPLDLLRPAPDPEAPSNAAQIVTYNHRGDRLVTGYSNGRAWLWQRQEDGRFSPLRALDQGDGVLLAARFSPDDRLIATTLEGADGAISLWDGISGAPKSRLLGHGGSVAEVAFSPDARWLASVSEDGTARLWDIATEKTVSVMAGHRAGVPSLALVITAGRPRLVTGSWDGTVRLWDGLTGAELALFSGHALGVPDVALDPAGRFAISVSWDGTARVWLLQEAGQALIDQARSLDLPAYADAAAGRP